MGGRAVGDEQSGQDQQGSARIVRGLEGLAQKKELPQKDEYREDIDLAGDPEKCRRLGNQAMEDVKSFSPANICDQWVSLYTERQVEQRRESSNVGNS